MFQKVLNALLMPAFDWIQVEVSSCCNAVCTYCPHTVYRNRWLNRHMSLETFGKLAPVFKRTKLVYLQGWGEPLLNPCFFEMVKEAKRAGCAVGTTTNGTMIDDEMARKIVRSGLDILTVSLAHTDARHDALREGARLDNVLEALRLVQQEKERSRSEKPAIHVAYLLIRSNRGEVKGLPALLHGRGVRQVVISALDFVPSPGLLPERLYPRTEEEYEAVIEDLEGVRSGAEKAGMALHYQIACAGRRRLQCSENVHAALFVSADGNVSPCVFMNIPVSSGQDSYERLTFGNIHDQPLQSIWNSRCYRVFRRSFSQDRLMPQCAQCPKLCLT